MPKSSCDGMRTYERCAINLGPRRECFYQLLHVNLTSDMHSPNAKSESAVPVNPTVKYWMSNVLITGGEFVNVSESRMRIAFEKLEKASASSALHDSSARFDPPQCHPNTRVAILEYLMGWILGHNDPDALILWLYGPAGAGKSAILQTIAERCFERKILLASFFFGRLDPTRNTVKPFIATLAYQLTITLPQIKPLVESAIERDPLIFDKSLATQLQSLIVNPLKDLSASGFFKNPETCARLILIDGLDECQDPRMQSMVIRFLADTLRSQKLPLIFLIASRPEQHITIAFNSASAAGLWRSLVLDDSFDPEDDIRIFLVDSFEEIRTTHPLKHLVPHAWPNESDVDMLVTKSSGQFIYASVVVKYISAHHDRPHDRLEVIKGLRPARREVPFSELDAVYMHLLSSCSDSSMVISILGCIVIEISVTEDIEILLDLQPGDVDIALAPLHSILNFRDTPSKHTFLSFCHASFGDFLVDASRAGQFWISTSASNEQILSSCVEKIMNPLLIDTNRHSQSGSLLLGIWGPIDTIVHHMPLTETMEEILMAMSLPRIWTAWDTITYSETQQSIRTPISERSHFITILLSSICPDPIIPITDSVYREEYQKIYEHHVNAFEPILKSEVLKYHTNSDLTSLLIVTQMGLQPVPKAFPGAYNSLIRQLLHLSDDSIDFDYTHCQFVSRLGLTGNIFSHYVHLLSGPQESSELRFGGDDYAQTALRILQFLCSEPPYATPNSRNFIPPKYSHRKHPTHFRYSRIRRLYKNRYGMRLISNAPELACKIGIGCLIRILPHSSSMVELKDFIRTATKEVAFLPYFTHRAIRAMYEYLEK